MAQINDALIVQLSADIKGLTAGLITAGNNVEKFSKKAEKDIGGIETALSTARTAVLAFGGAWAAWEAGKQIVEAGMQMQALENRMKAATGSAEVSADAMAYVRAECERLGISFVTAADGFAGFSASALRAGLTLGQTKDIFTGISEAATAMHLSSDSVGLVFKALEQMASKGTVQMEELKGQLGESLPGAFEIAAKAMGVTTGALGEMMQKGQVMSADFLPKFAAQVRQEFGGSLEDATHSAQAAFNRLENALFEFKAKFASAGLLDAVTDGVVELTAVLNDPQIQAGLMSMATMLGQIAAASVQAAAGIGNVISKANGLIEKAGDKAFSMLPGGADAIKRERTAKADAGTFQQRMVAQYVGDFQKEHPAAPPKDLSGYTMGKVSAPDTSAADEKARKKAEREAEAARKKAEREAKQQAQERETLSGQVRSMDVSMGSDPEKYKAELEDQQKLLEEALSKKAITQQKYNDMMKETQAAYTEQLKEYVIDQFGSETDQENERYADKQKKLEEALELKLVTEEDFRRMTEELEQEHQDNLTDIREDAARKQLQQQEKINQFRENSEEQVLSSIHSLAQLFANKNKTVALALLAFEKGVAIARAIIETHVAAAAALKYDPTGATSAYVTALGYANVALIAATGIAQASMLASSGGGSSTGSSSSGGTSFNSSTGQYESNTTGGRGGSAKQVFINIQGSEKAVFSRSEMRQIVDQINEVQKDGSTVEVYIN